jgi:hypothetical protein
VNHFEMLPDMSSTAATDPLRAEALARLQQDGRLGAWVNAHVSGWEHSDWLSLLAELKRDGFWPLPFDRLWTQLDQSRRVKCAARLAETRGRIRAGKPVVCAPPNLTVPLRGVWYSRKTGNPAADWLWEASLPGIVDVKLDRHYCLKVHPDVQDEELSLLACLHDFPALHALHLASCDQVTASGIYHLANVPQLRALEINLARIDSNSGLEPLRDLMDLRSLVLHKCYAIPDSALLGLESMRHLESLTIWGCRKLTDAGFQLLKMHGQLKSIGLWGCSQLTDRTINHLSTLRCLETLTLHSCPQITLEGLAPLQSLPRLRHLNVYRCGTIVSPDISELRKLLPKCTITIISEPYDLRRNRLVPQLLERVQMRKKASDERGVSKPESPAKPQPDHPHSTIQPQQRKSWWQVWK